MSAPADPTLSTFRGGCHCGAVRFEVDTAVPIVAHDCNCSLCTMSGFLHLIVPASRFRLLAGADRLRTYSFNTGVARHLFCGHCGVKSFYVPRSNPDGYSINLRCLESYPEFPFSVEPFDGRNWEAAGDALRNLSKEEKHQ